MIWGGSSMYRLLVVEDEKVLNIGLQTCLKEAGYEVYGVFGGNDALAAYRDNLYDLIILDVNLPDINGFELYRKFKNYGDVPVVFLTARDEENDIILGFDLGADDYITKPFSLNIFLKKIAAILKRCNKSDVNTIYESGNLWVDLDKREVKIDGRIISLTPTEYKILEIFISNKNIVLTKEVLLEKLWDNSNNWVDEHVVPVNISRLRNKLDNGEKKFIKTIFGVGYLWSDADGKQ